MSSTPQKSLGCEFFKAATGISFGTGIAAAAYFGEGTDGMVCTIMGVASGLMVYAVTEPVAKKLNRVPEFFKRHFS